MREKFGEPDRAGKLPVWKEIDNNLIKYTTSWFCQYVLSDFNCTLYLPF